MSLWSDIFSRPPAYIPPGDPGIPSEMGRGYDDPSVQGGGSGADPNTEFSGWLDFLKPGYMKPGGPGNPRPRGGAMADDFSTDDIQGALDMESGSTSTALDQLGLGGRYQAVTLGSLGRPYGISGKKLLWAIYKFGMAIVPCLASMLGVQQDTILYAYFRSRGRSGRRGRGVTGRQLRNARRVYHVISKMYHQLHGRGGGGGTVRYAFHRRRKGKR